MFEKVEVLNDSDRAAVYSISGFWSTDYLTVRQSKNRSGHWEPSEINWSCGGRTNSDLIKTYEAAMNFAHAIIDASEIANKWDKEC